MGGQRLLRRSAVVISTGGVTNEGIRGSARTYLSLCDRLDSRDRHVGVQWR